MMNKWSDIFILVAPFSFKEYEIIFSQKMYVILIVVVVLRPPIGHRLPGSPDLLRYLQTARCNV